MTIDILPSSKSVDLDFVNKEKTIHKLKYSTYNVKLIRDEIFSGQSLSSLFETAEKVVYSFILLIIYFFVALEEIDYQFLASSRNYVDSEDEFDEWSIWKLLENRKFN